MFNISSFLEKISKSVQSKEFYNEQIIDVIEKNTNIKLKSEDVELKDNIVLIKCSPAIKNRLFISRGKILEEISVFTPVRVIDIR